MTHFSELRDAHSENLVVGQAVSADGGALLGRVRRLLDRSSPNSDSPLRRTAGVLVLGALCASMVVLALYSGSEHTDAAESSIADESQSAPVTPVPRTKAARGQPGEKPTVLEGPWGEAANGLESRIVLPRRQFKQGEPIEPRVVVRNASDKPIPYDLSATGRDAIAGVSRFEVIGPDGVHVADISHSAQTDMDLDDDPLPELKPGEEITVPCNRLDTHHYMRAPGRYRIRWTGLHPMPSKSDMERFMADSFREEAAELPDGRAPSLPPSATVEIEVVPAPGGGPGGDLVGRLLKILPPGWKVEGATLLANDVKPVGRPAGRGSTVGLVHRPVPGLLPNNAGVRVYVMDAASAPNSGVADTSLAEYLGRGTLGHVYLSYWQHNDPLARWSHAAHDIASAIEVSDPKPQTPRGIDWGRLACRILQACSTEARKQETLQQFCCRSQLSSNARHLLRIFYRSNAAASPDDRKVEFVREDSDQPYYYVNVSVEPIAPEGQQTMISVDKSIRWDGESNARAYTVQRLGVQIRIAVASDDEGFRRTLNAILDRQVTRVLGGGTRRESSGTGKLNETGNHGDSTTMMHVADTLIAWGKPADGLRAGLRLFRPVPVADRAPKPKPEIRVGQVVHCDVVVENVSGETIHFTSEQAAGPCRVLSVRDAAGRRVEVGGPAYDGPVGSMRHSLGTGDQAELPVASCGFAPTFPIYCDARQTTWACVGPGKYRLSASTSLTGGGLRTGELELEVLPPNEAELTARVAAALEKRTDQFAFKVVAMTDQRTGLRSLRLLTYEPKGKYPDHWTTVQIDREQADAIIRHLAEAGYLWRTVAEPYDERRFTKPSYFLSVSLGDESEPARVTDLAPIPLDWGPATETKLKDLREALAGDAVAAMDELLGRLKHVHAVGTATALDLEEPAENRGAPVETKEILKLLEAMEAEGAARGTLRDRGDPQSAMRRLVHWPVFRRLLEAGRKDRESITPILRTMLRKAVADWPDAHQERAELWEKSPNGFTLSGWTDYERVSVRALVATYLLAELGDHEFLPLLLDLHKRQTTWFAEFRCGSYDDRVLVPPTILLYAMHRLVISLPEDQLNQAARDLRQEYQRWASKNLRRPFYWNGTKWDSAPEPSILESGQRPLIAEVRGEPNIVLYAYPSRFKDGTTLRDGELSTQFTAIGIEWVREISRFVEVAYASNSRRAIQPGSRPTTQPADEARDPVPGEPVAGLKCKARALKTRLPFGEEPRFEVTLTNVSDKPLDVIGEARSARVLSGGAYVPCACYRITHGDGHYTIHSLDRPSPNTRALRIEPSKSWSFVLPSTPKDFGTIGPDQFPSLSALLPGKYTAEVVYSIRDVEKQRHGANLAYGPESGNLAGQKPQKLWEGVARNLPVKFEVLDDDSKQLAMLRAIHAGKGREHLRLELTKKEEIVGGKPRIALQLRARNTGKESLYLGSDYGLIRLGPDGEEVPSFSGPRSGTVTVVSPGEVKELGGWGWSWEGKKPGRHTVWVRYVAPKTRALVAESNRLILETPPLPAEKKDDVAWGQPADGLRCGWVQSQGPVAVGAAPKVAVQVENVGGDPVVFECLQEISWAVGPDPRYGPGNFTMPKFQVDCARKARLSTYEEVEKLHQIWIPGMKKEEPVPGYYHLEPSGKLTLSAALPWRIQKRGPVKIESWVSRYRSPSGRSTVGMETEMRLPPLVLQVVEGDAESDGDRP